MKNKVYINYNFEPSVDYYLRRYLCNYGEKAVLINGKSKREVYARPHCNYQVVIWQTKTLINVEVMR